MFMRSVGRWLSDYRGWRVHAVLIITIVMAAGCTPRVCGTISGAKQIPCPLSRSDTDLVMKWIATEVVRSRQPFCWRRTYTIKPWNKCRRRYKKVLFVCWQRCTSGRRVCGAGCSRNGFQCFKNTAKMIVAPLMLAVNIATFGSATGATTAARAATKLGKLKALVRKAGKNPKGLRKKGDKLTAFEKGKLAYRVGSTGFELFVITKLWLQDYLARFTGMTTPRVTRELQRRFSGDALVWIQEQYALNHLNLVMEANKIRTGKTVLSIVGTWEPTGVAGVIDAFTHKKCPWEKPFPMVRLRAPYASR